MLKELVADNNPIAISYVDNLRLGKFREYVDEKQAGFIETAFYISAKKQLFISFNLDSIISKIELGDGIRANRIVLLERSYTGTLFVNPFNLENLYNEHLNFYLDYYNDSLKIDDSISKELIVDTLYLIELIIKILKTQNDVYTIVFTNLEYRWNKKRIDYEDIDFWLKSVIVNQWDSLQNKKLIDYVYSSDIMVLPPDIRPDINPHYCVIQSSIGCKVKDKCGKACHFCNSYQGISFREYSSDELSKQIVKLKEVYPKSLAKINTCFFADGDAISANNFLYLVDKSKEMIPNIINFESFISTYTILNTPINKWSQFRESGLSCLYWGVESADNDTLRFLGKPQNEKTLFEARNILERFDIPYAIIVMCGLSKIRAIANDFSNHVFKTCNFINESHCKKVYISKLHIIPGTALYTSMVNGAFIPMGLDDIDLEYRNMINLIIKSVQGAYGNQFYI